MSSLASPARSAGTRILNPPSAGESRGSVWLVCASPMYSGMPAASSRPRNTCAWCQSSVVNTVSKSDACMLSPEVDLEIAELVDLQRAPGVHHHGGVGRLDHRRPLDRVSRYEECAVVDRGCDGLPRLGPVDAALAVLRLRIDPRAEFSRCGELRAWRRRGRAQPQRHDLQARVGVRRAAAVELLVALLEALAKRTEEGVLHALLRQHHLDLVDLAAVAHVQRKRELAPPFLDAVPVHLRGSFRLEAAEDFVDARGF